MYPSTFAKGLIIGLSLILAVCLIPAIINLSINQTVFKSDFYAGVLRRTNFYDQVPAVIADKVMASGSSAMQGGLLAGLNQEQFIWMMTSMLPPGWIETQTEAAMDSVLDFLNFKTETLTIRVDLQPIKDYLSSPAGKQSLLNLLDNLPDCSDEQLTQIMIAMQSGQGGFALCQPPSSDLFNMDMMLDPVINSFSASLPTVILLPPANEQGSIQKIIKSPVFLAYQSIRRVLELFPWICLVLAMMILLLSLRSLRWMATALGVPLVFASLVAAIPGVWLFLTGGQGINGVPSGTSLLGSLQGFEGLLVGVIQEGFKTAGQGLLVWCVGALAIGLVFISIRLVAQK
ncbi:MAG: hypothetical protein C0410_08065 [Anaerolinea sp.]|nr:hypothetical protein [Anaerolinea sp.]